MDKLQSWNYVALHAHSVPSAPVTEVARKRLHQFWRRLWPGDRGVSDGSRQVTQKSSIEFFGELFASPDWEATSSSLAAVVDEGLAGGRTAQTFVGGPHRCTPDMLRRLAHNKSWPLLEAPPAHEILERPFEPPTLGTNSVVVIPQLAHWYLRHENGLDMIRGLLDWLHTTRQPAVLGCHSWAWSYLDHVIQLGGALPEPHVLAPLDAAALSGWFQQLAAGFGAQQAVFREAASGKLVLDLSCAPSGAGHSRANGGASNLLTHIASHGRGLPEITWSLWRESILRFKQDMVTEEAAASVAARAERTIWVPSWAQLSLPELPTRPGHLPLFLMHSLLLHAGLPAEILPRLLPFARVEIQRGLRELQAIGVAEPVEDRWRVTASGYPAVRSKLNDEGFLVDPL